jgi:hypothetical protein
MQTEIVVNGKTTILIKALGKIGKLGNSAICSFDKTFVKKNLA